ncbi:MAG: hypothetical protein HLUCCA12_12015 [Rhodobacteraceae bacterium HLUCCA12]|nr:MAG: hypothetical protein HLUCCA12_12015 [Rhodobacteraceae bacterium HLUCCA12]
MITRFTNPPAAVANARRIVCDPVTCAASPTLARIAWLILHSARGRPAIQSHLVQPRRTQ